jgi:hypothetical protein
MKIIQPILIDARNRVVLRLPARAWELEDIREAIGVELITVAGLPLENGDELILDDEGLINGTEDYFLFDGCAQPFAGSALVVGAPDDDGNSTDPKSSTEEIADRVTFLPREAFKREYLEEITKPQVINFESAEDMIHFMKTGEIRGGGA